MHVAFFLEQMEGQIGRINKIHLVLCRETILMTVIFAWFMTSKYLIYIYVNSLLVNFSLNNSPVSSNMLVNYKKPTAIFDL